ncbi:carbohydrate kinase family protein [Mesorhizobium sp. CAU 1732]|uniref:carbohydrate kinase family protein n=1 Tax=Mesorhizobium sp. CAU 1732 TaxID=3140358 RepID=UPI003260A0ED
MSGERILVLGNVNVDLVMGEVDGWPAVGTEVILPRSEMRAGGSAGNTALALSGLGVPHRLIAGVGADMMGDWLSAQFDGQFSTWIAMDVATTVTVGIVHAGGDRAFFTTTGHLHQSRLDDLVQRLPAAPGEKNFAIISGGFLMPEIETGTSELIAALKRLGWTVAIDPGWPTGGWTARNRAQMQTWMNEADFSLINAEEAMGIVDAEQLEAALDTLFLSLAPAKIIVVKCGADGVRILAGDRVRSIEAPEVEVVDTVGAGDTFNAAFLAALSEDADLAEAAARGVRAASSALSTFPRRYDA